VTPQVISACLAGGLPPWKVDGDQLVIYDQSATIDMAVTVAELLDNPATQQPPIHGGADS
jgi:hypothetical protein